jgi:hypothetical protein
MVSLNNICAVYAPSADTGIPYMFPGAIRDVMISHENHKPRTTNYVDVIWKREEPKELTVAQIEKELGYKVKIVGEQK